MVIIVQSVDAPGATCDPGDFSEPTSINLHMVDDDGDGVFNDSKTIVCEGGGATTNVKMDVLFRGPKNCLDSVPPFDPGSAVGKSTGTVTSTATGSAGTPAVVESTLVKCSE
jgi:hypothetical protein